MVRTPQTWPAEGIYRGIDPAVYFGAQPQGLVNWTVSKSLLWQFARNPKRWLKSPPMVVTEAMKWGSLIDCLLLTPERFKDAYAVQPETYVSQPESFVLTDHFPGEWNGRLKVCREWRAEQEAKGLVVLTPEQLAEASQPKPWNWNSDTCKAWRDSRPRGVEIVSAGSLGEAEQAVRELCDRPELAALLAGDSQTQVGMRYHFHDLIHGIPGFVVPAKGLIDIVPDVRGEWGSCLGDLKETAKLDDLDQIERTIFTMGYHVQAALYLDMWNALTGEDREKFIFVFQLSVPPYEVAIIELDADAIVAGRECYLKAIRKWAHVVSTGRWSSPWDGIKTAKLPAWAGRKAAA